MILPDDMHTAFIGEHANDDAHRLLLNASRYPEIDIEFVVRQLEGRKKAAVKFPSLLPVKGFVYPVKLSMEQCSSEQTATYKASLIAGQSVADLTGGLGIDALFMSRDANGYCYVERNAELAEIAAHNFAVCGARVESVCDEAFGFLEKRGQRFDCIYLDPARRDDNKNKVVRLDACEPNVPANLDFVWRYADRLLIKASPMLDISMAMHELGCVERVHVVAVKNECRELLFECRPLANHTGMVCVNIEPNSMSVFEFTPGEERSASVDYAEYPLEYLYEPNAALLKAGAFRLCAFRYGLQKLHPDTHLYTASGLCENFPGRIFRVVGVGGLNKKFVRDWLPDKKANIAVRNYPMRPEEIKKQLGISDGGEDYLFAATFKNGDKRGIVCRKI